MGRRRERGVRARNGISAPRRSRRAEGDARAWSRFANDAPPEPDPSTPPRLSDQEVRSSLSAPSAATRRAVPSAPSRAMNDSSLGRGGSGTASRPSQPDPGRPPWLPERRCETRSALERDPRSTPETSSRVSPPAGVRAGADGTCCPEPANVSFSNPPSVFLHQPTESTRPVVDDELASLSLPARPLITSHPGSTPRRRRFTPRTVSPRCPP